VGGVIDLSIVIVNWNGRAVLEACLASLDREVRGRRDPGRIETETFVVDNASRDGSVDAVRQRFPWVELVALPENRGFAAGCNVGLRRRRGRHALLLNPDTVVARDVLESCLRWLDAHPEVGAVGPRLLNPDGSVQSSVHAYPSLLLELVPRALLEWLAPRRYPSKRSIRGPAEVDALLGACLCVRGEVLERVGLLPEEYFLFLEETDWCFQMRRAGWRIVHLPDVSLMHVHGASSKRLVPARTRIEFHRSLYRFFRRQRGPGQAALVVALRAAKSALHLVTGAPAALLSARGRERWGEWARVLAWHLRGCPADAGLAGLRAVAPDVGSAA
jgi:hypothetical protein